jgi:hypothetical protein
VHFFFYLFLCASKEKDIRGAGDFRNKIYWSPALAGVRKSPATLFVDEFKNNGKYNNLFIVVVFSNI